MQPWEFWLSIACFVGVAVSRCHPGHRPGHRDRGHRVPVGRLASVLRGAGTRQRASRATMTSRAIPMPPDPRPGSVSLGRAPVLRQRRAFQGTSPGGGGGIADAGPLGRGRGRAGHQRRRHRRRCPRRTRCAPCTPQGIELRFAELKDPVKDKMKRFGLFAQLGEHLRSFRRSMPPLTAISQPIRRGMGGMAGPGQARQVTGGAGTRHEGGARRERCLQTCRLRGCWVY